MTDEEYELRTIQRHVRARRRRDYEAAIITGLCFAAVICILIAEACR